MLFSSYEILLIKRFLFSKKTDGFISIFSWFSIIGITIGVAAIIIVMAVMNGFREELISRLLGINGHLNIYSNSGQITKEEVNIIKSDFSDNQLIPLIQTQALVISNEFSKGVFLRGYDNEYLDDLHFLGSLIAVVLPKVWKSKQYILKTKIRLYNSNVKSI
jgi:lipoprotein-releasing system permease protein